MIAVKKNINNYKLPLLSQNLLKTLAYYDIFSYPLTKDEIFYNTYTNGDTKESTFDEIDNLTKNGLIHFNNGFYSICNNQYYSEKRVKGNRRALGRIKSAKFYSKLISKFPFVRAVLISGSLSKGYMDEDADIDYFVVTKSNRLWISRFLLMLFKKTILLNSKKNFCINYYITTDNLEIENKNIYSAIELASLLPMYNSDIYHQLLSANQWIKKYVPNYPKRDIKNIKKFKLSLTQRIIEPLFRNNFGNRIDDYLMHLFYNFDKKKYSDFDEKTFNSSFIIRKNISTHHPESFQNKVLNALEQKISHLKSKHNILLSKV